LGQRRIRVLQLIDILKGGGAEEWVKEISRLLDPGRFEIKVCYLLESPRKTYPEEIANLGAKVIYIGLNRKLSSSILASPALSENTYFRALARHLYIFYSLTKLRSLYRTIVKERIDLIHTHLHYSFLLASILGKHMDIPVVCQIPQMRSQTIQTAPWSFFAYRMLQNSVDAFYTNISEEELIVHASIPREKIRFIKGVIDLDSIDIVERSTNPLVEEFGLEDRFPILLSMGRFVPEKGHIHAVEAASRMRASFPKLKLFILGEGWELERFKRLIREKNLEDVIELPGYRRDLNNFYSIADIYLRTCLIEGGSLANYNAMAYGNPIVGFETKAPTETITHEKNGFLAPYGDIEKMVEYTLSLARDPELCKRLSRASRDFAHQNLDIRDTIKSIEQEYLRLCNGRKRNYRKKKKIRPPQ
jgi:glycosyltransferase involved in cell wall biosynthesis